MKYLKKFNDGDAFRKWLLSDEHELPNVALVDSALAYNAEGPLYIEALENNMAVSFTNTIEYRIEGGEWTSLPASTATPPIAIGSRVYFCASNITPSSTEGIGNFTITKRCNIGGNIMSMAYGVHFFGQTRVSEYQFCSLFGSATNIVDASRLALPATTLAKGCYREMFRGCTSLTSAPALPATTLAERCYSDMFQGCTSLTTAPELPATTLADRCYSAMFYDCTSLVNAPALPATTLASNCYSEMFLGCTSLVNAPELPATTLASYCYGRMFFGCTKLNYIKAMFTTNPSSNYTSYWVSGVAASGTFVKNAAATWTDTFDVSAIPTGWTVELAES